jgi:hypothetical protein
MLMSFLFRYSGIPLKKDEETRSSTAISKEIFIRSDSGETNFKKVHQIQNCVELFKTCYTWLMMQMTERFKGKGKGSEESIIGSIVNSKKLGRNKEKHDRAVSAALHKLNSNGNTIKQNGSTYRNSSTNATQSSASTKRTHLTSEKHCHEVLALNESLKRNHADIVSERTCSKAKRYRSNAKELA